ncbi:CHAP domain-containing protein [Salinibacterium soli]|uniref:CHAP domain-containing protein n=1 Tax=Antiquaquibacter soli TaxID=3064523 RepID=A0ABT9BR28_9MICO|nr:CHAP domain-containing protein [Protaetiibacter sp. WY-16]MDO7883430.1 CHAP domain-containing protein [Protaetiibacter sp. WY-16]
MVDYTPSGSSDDLFATEATPQPVQYTSRREAREALAAQSSAAGKPARRSVAPEVRVAPAEVRRELAQPAMGAVRASVAAQPKRNPLSVLATMAVVGGLFAVAGLPAYAQQEAESTTADAAPAGVAQSIEVDDDAVTGLATRDGFLATTPEQLAQANEDALRAAANEAYLASGARELGDDYPWPYELTDDQGGGLSPLNYYYRECVDFVAWRINRDQGYYAAPFKWVWSNLTPYGGNGGQWQYNWEALGRTVSNVPIPGAVAYTGGNHVAYVKSVNADGTVTLEEYNYVPGMYSQRTIPASSVVSFLYPPS